MNGYQKLKEQNERLKHEAEYNRHRATVYFIAMMSHIKKEDPKFKAIIKTAKYLFTEYKEEDHSYDPLLKFFEDEDR